MRTKLQKWLAFPFVYNGPTSRLRQELLQLQTDFDSLVEQRDQLQTNIAAYSTETSRLLEAPVEAEVLRDANC